MQLVRDYRVSGVDGDSAAAIVSVRRTSRVSISGQGVLRGDTVTLSGTGSGSATLRMRAATGWILDGEGTCALKLEARGQRRTQTVDQAASFSVRALPDSSRESNQSTRRSGISRHM
jgi:hypothetical protein